MFNRIWNYFNPDYHTLEEQDRIIKEFIDRTEDNDYLYTAYNIGLTGCTLVNQLRANSKTRKFMKSIDSTSLHETRQNGIIGNYLKDKWEIIKFNNRY